MTGTKRTVLGPDLLQNRHSLDRNGWHKTNRYIQLLLKMKMSRADGSIIKLLNKLSKTDLLILDDFGLTHMEQQHRMDLLELIEDLHGRKSTVIASLLPVASWYEGIGEETMADAILDRLIHTSYHIELKGESRRRKNM